MAAELTLDVIGPSFDPYDSYGLCMGETLVRLAQAGVAVNGIAVQRVMATQSDELRALLAQPPRRSHGQIVFGYPVQWREWVNEVPDVPRVLVTMFESTVLPPGWVETINADFDAVIVPSQWLVPVFESNGVRVPVVCVPLGVSDVFTFCERPARHPFTFLALGDRNWRKGWEEAVRAFYHTFGDDPDYRLIIKSRWRGAMMTVKSTNVVNLAQDMTPAELCALYHSVDCFVFPTYGEGFGLPPREAAATGLPVIATAWGGTADDVDQWGIPLNYTLTSAWPGETFDGLGEWAKPDKAHLGELMAQVTRGEHPAPRAVSDAVRRLYTWDQFASGALAVWQGITQRTYA